MKAILYRENPKVKVKSVSSNSTAPTMVKYRKDKPMDSAGLFMIKININSTVSGNTQSQKLAISLLLEARPISSFWITRRIALK
jgi:hypothetical protein